MLLLLLAISVSSCATSGPRSESTDTVCALGALIMKSSDVINDALLDKIIAINEYGEKYCKWRPPQKVNT